MKLILVPTDGSPESEKALPLAEEIARAQRAEILLVTVIDEPPIVAPGYGATSAEVYEAILRENEAAANAHLAGIAERLAAAGLRVRTAVGRGPPAAALLDWEALENPDLLIMATHGRTGLARFALGSVAERMVREGTAPVLLVRRSSPAPTRARTALVMLDGSGIAEQSLPIVEQLAGRPLEAVILFRAVSDPEDRRAAMHYLDGVRAAIEPTGLGVTCIVEVGDPPRAAMRAAADADLVILCTHGRSGIDRLRHGSVADAVLREIDRPTLLVRARAQAQ